MLRLYFLTVAFTLPLTIFAAGKHRQCKGLLTKGTSIVTFATCKANEQCNELHCNGRFRNVEFHSVASLDFCSSPTILHMFIKESDKNHSHAFKDGDTFKMPHRMTVGLKRTGNEIAINISIAKQFLVQNVVVNIDPSYCSKSGKSKSLSGAATAALIALGVVIFLVLLIGLVIWLWTTKRFSLRRPARQNNLAMFDDSNPLYDDFEPACITRAFRKTFNRIWHIIPEL